MPSGAIRDDVLERPNILRRMLPADLATDNETVGWCSAGTTGSQPPGPGQPPHTTAAHPSDGLPNITHLTPDRDTVAITQFDPVHSSQRHAGYAPPGLPA